MLSISIRPSDSGVISKEFKRVKFQKGDDEVGLNSSILHGPRFLPRQVFAVNELTSSINSIPKLRD
jgi:hypothetical protein